MRALDKGVSFDVPSANTGWATAWFKAWCTLVKTDYLAGQKLGPWKESTQAHSYDRGSTLSSTSPNYGKPTSYVRKGAGISNHWRVLSVEELEAAVQAAARLKSAAARKVALDTLGINESKYIFRAGRAYPNFPLHHSFIPLLNWIRQSPYDWMHVGACGLARYEGAEMHAVFIRLGWYDLATLNNRPADVRRLARWLVPTPCGRERSEDRQEWQAQGRHLPQVFGLADDPLRDPQRVFAHWQPFAHQGPHTPSMAVLVGARDVVQHGHVRQLHV